MRIVHHQDELEQLYKIATAEAQVAFNDPSVFIEKYLENPKHKEDAEDFFKANEAVCKLFQ